MTDPVPPVVARVAAAVRYAYGADPLDEATHRRLARHGLKGVTFWSAGREAFALRHDGALDLAVAPEIRRQGTGAWLAAKAVAEPGELTAWSHGDHPAARVLADRHGFDRARELWVMRRSMTDPLPEPAVAHQVRVRGYLDADRAELLRVNAAAFAHHPEQGDMDDADLAERMAEDWFDPADLLVADTGAAPGSPGALAGFHWTKRHDRRLGEVYVVGIDPVAQGRGLGRVLTLAGLIHLRDAGLEEVLLYVESDNTAAVRLYSGLGFSHAGPDTHVQYHRAGDA